MTANDELAKRASLEYHVVTSIDDELNTPPGKDDPLSKWASSTLDALGPPLNAQPPTPEFAQGESSSPTPGSVAHLVPGAFPRAPAAESISYFPDTQHGNKITAEPATEDSYIAIVPQSEDNSIVPTEHSAAPLHPPSHDANSTKTGAAATHSPVIPEADIETMREGTETQIVKKQAEQERAPENTQRPLKPESEHPDHSTVVASWDEYRAREGQTLDVGGADTDASTRSLAGTQLNQSLYTPGTSLFSGKLHEDSQSGIVASPNGQDESASQQIVNAVNAENAPSTTDTKANSQPEHLQPVHHAAPVTVGREHPLASQIGPAPSDISLTTGLQGPDSFETKAGLRPGERVDSSVAAPGHGPSTLLPKADESTGAESKPPASTTKKGVAEDAPSAHFHDTHHTDGKKSGFFEKLKEGMRAFGGKHHHHHKSENTGKDKEEDPKED